MASRSQPAEPSPAEPAPGGVASSAAINSLPDDYPVRDYVGSMSAELARMARWDGDEALARVLEAAVRLAEQPAPRHEPIALDRSPKTGHG